MIEIIAGPSNTIPIAGAMNNAKGKSSLIVVLAAASSAFCRRSTRKASENVASDFESGIDSWNVRPDRIGLIRA